MSELVVLWPSGTEIVPQLVPQLVPKPYMCIELSPSFVHFFLAFISLLLAFGLAFSVLFPDEESFAETPFLTSPIKVL